MMQNPRCYHFSIIKGELSLGAGGPKCTKTNKKKLLPKAPKNANARKMSPNAHECPPNAHANALRMPSSKMPKDDPKCQGKLTDCPRECL